MYDSRVFMHTNAHTHTKISIIYVLKNQTKNGEKKEKRKRKKNLNAFKVKLISYFFLFSFSKTLLYFDLLKRNTPIINIYLKDHNNGLLGLCVNEKKWKKKNFMKSSLYGSGKSHTIYVYILNNDEVNILIVTRKSIFCCCCCCCCSCLAWL